MQRHLESMISRSHELGRSIWIENAWTLYISLNVFFSNSLRIIVKSHAITRQVIFKTSTFSLAP